MFTHAAPWRLARTLVAEISASAIGLAKKRAGSRQPSGDDKRESGSLRGANNRNAPLRDLPQTPPDRGDGHPGDGDFRCSFHHCPPVCRLSHCYNRATLLRLSSIHGQKEPFADELRA
jgi:hypothetical protein